MNGWRNMRKGSILIFCVLLISVLFPVDTYASSISNRLAGQDRFQTARIISEQFNADSVQDVILTSGNDFPDALAASVLAKKLNAPILLVDSKIQGSNEAFNYISRHLSKEGTVHIIGGVGVIDTDFDVQLTRMGFQNIERIGGSDRYDTDIMIAQKLAVEKNTPVVIASGESFPDAISISSFAANKGWPVLLVGKDYLAPGIKNYIATKQPSQVYIVGGSAVVSEAVKSQIQSLVPIASITRLAGRDRFETNALVIQTFAPNPKNIYYATGLDFADALAGSAIASKEGDPIMLIDPNSLLVPTSSMSYLSQLHDLNIEPAIVCFGGNNVVPSMVINNVDDFLKGNITQDSLLSTDQDNPAITASLPAVGSRENLLKLLADLENYGVRYGLMTDSAGQFAGGTSPAPKAEANDASPVTRQDDAYSETNLQVEGVDEADIIKTDGEYIYQVISAGADGQLEVVISKVYPASELKIVTKMQYPGQKFTPRELYVDKKHLVVIGDSYDYQVETKSDLQPDSVSSLVPYYQPMTHVFVYDLSDMTSLVKVRELKLDGNYVSSRKIDSDLYLVTNKYIDYYRILHQNEVPANPIFSDSNFTDGYAAIPFQDIRCFPGSVEPNYLLVAGLDLEAPSERMQVRAYLGSGDNIMASVANLYVAVTHYEWPKEPVTDGNAATFVYPPVGPNTLVYKFSLNNGKTAYLGKAEIPGTLLNQFSMDEYDGYLRLATTSGFNWSTRQASENNAYVLNPDMSICGKLEKIAPGEQIYAVRFMGKRGYMVTYQTVDPLFVLDLQDPSAPKVLGELKIPGYSNYLHPYDETHLLGIGKDSMETKIYNGYTGETSTVAYYLGMKLSLFDVSDVNNPIELFKTNIGDRGTDSEVLYNHKALLFSREKNLLAFPINVCEVKDQGVEYYGVPPYGELTFQGTYVYNLDLTTGFTLKGEVSHLGSGVFPRPVKPYDNFAYAFTPIQRILYIGSNLYTVSESMIKVNDLESMKEKGIIYVSKNY
ncbi:MAG: beta-propeller domain-containing protein [Desulfosporosinus sp.]